IWLGHSDGISSVQGETVTNFYASDGLIDNDVWCIAADAEGKIWIGTVEGVCVFDGKQFVPLEMPEGIKDPTLGVSSARMVHQIVTDRRGNLWITSNAGLFSYANNQLTHVSREAGIQTNFVNRLFEDSKGGLWISSNEGLYYLKDNVARNITAGKIELKKGIGSVAEDKDGVIWFVANQHHLYSYDGTSLTEFQKTEDN